MSGNVIPVEYLFRVSPALLPRGPERQYFMYDYEHGYALQLVREGACTGCGACCQAATQLQAAQTERHPILGLVDVSDTVRTQGVWEGAEDGDNWCYYSSVVRSMPAMPCTAHGSDGRCKIHHVGKPILCQEWPMGPAQAALYPECGYWFKPVRAFLLDESGQRAAPISLEGVAL